MTELKFKSHGKWWKCDLHSYDLQELSEDEQDVSSLPVHTRVRPSRSGGNETSITFINHTKGDVQVYWIDFEGERRYYARVRAGQQHRQHTYARHVWLVTDEGGKTLAVFVATEEAGDAVIDDTGTREAAVGRRPTAAKTRGESPDGNWFAFVKDYNLYVRKIETGEEITLSSDGTEENTYSERFWWSPDSEKLAAVQTRKGEDRKIHLIESAPKEQLQPKLHTLSYTKPGDRILWMKAAAAKYPYIDITRVGIYGGSAGGQSALRALLAHGDFYKVAVADCGCHDNRMDKIWWNELWMGWPVGPHYEEQSNVTQAHKLQGKLLLTVGELDKNVDPASTMQVVDALIKADKDFDLLVIPGRGHGVGETPYASRRRMDFFVRHLLGIEPRSQP